MSLKTATIRDANVYVNGTTTHGQSTEITLPEINPSKAEYKALGLVGTLKLFTGFEAMEASIKWSAPDADILEAFLNPTVAVDLMVYASRDVYVDGTLDSQQPVIYHLKGTPATSPLGTNKPKENTETETKIDLTYVKMTQNGEEVFELDIANNIFVVGGTDILAKYRENLGL